MSHFTTAVSLSGVAKTWSRITLQSFQDLWKYPLHVFSCMCAWVRVFFCLFVGLFVFEGYFLLTGCGLSLPRSIELGKFTSSFPNVLVFDQNRLARASLSAGTFVRLCRAVDRKWGATIKHKKRIAGSAVQMFVKANAVRRRRTGHRITDTTRRWW